MSDLADILGQIEWYDNSTLKLIDACQRKAFFSKEITVNRPAEDDPSKTITLKGLKAPVGPGALYGTTWHYATGKLYSMRGGYSREDCEKIAQESFATMHGKMFPENAVQDTKHSLERGLDVLDLYCSHWRNEDELLRPVETELAALVPIRYIENRDRYYFDPFFYVARADGIVDRVNSNDRFIRELKTTSGGADRELIKLKMSRQPTGYQWTFNEFETDRYIVGTYADVVAVLKEERKPEKLFRRDIFRRSKVDLEYWRAETIVKVERWRQLKNRAYGSRNYIPESKVLVSTFDLLTTFTRNTEECLAYGQCPFYNLCYYNLETSDLESLSGQDWNPLRAEVL